MAKYKSGEFSPSDDIVEHAWVALEEARDYDLIDGIYEELEIAVKRRSGNLVNWHQVKTNQNAG